MTRFGVGLDLSLPNLSTHCQSVHNTGCREVRFALNWNWIEIQPGAYDWSWYDPRIKTVRDHDLGILPVVYRTPAWHRPNWQDPPDPAVYANFLRRANEHLNAPVYELWNETNLANLDWSGTAQQYAAVYRAARAALHGDDPTKQAMVGGLAYPNGVDYLRGIWPALGDVDCVGWHPYGLTVVNTYDLMQDMSRFLKSVGAGAVPIDVTEVGLPVGPGRPYTEKQRATYLKQMASSIKEWRRIRRFNVYTWHNHPEWDIATETGAWKGGASGYATGIKGH